MQNRKEVRQETIGSWLYGNNTNATEYSNYKLHIALNTSIFDKYHKEIYQILLRAVQDGVIPAFKMLNVGDSASLVEELGGKLSIQENANSRLINNPFTIYVYQEINYKQIADLCGQLERVLKDTPSCNRDHLSKADLPLTNHISFRQEKLDGKYIKISDAKESELEELLSQGENSSQYKALNHACQTKQKKNEEFNDEYEKENYVQGFYNNKFNYYKENLNSRDVNKQIKAACHLLEFEPEIFEKINNKEKILADINKKFRQLSLKFHTDKLGALKLESTVDRAKEIFVVLQNAKSVLEEVVKNPSLIDKNKLLEQEPNLPKYQYELQGGYVDDPYYYANMAKSTKYFTLVQNYDFTYDIPEAIGEDNNSIQIYKPQLQIYRGAQRKIITVPGYEAFYHLFKASALPRRFDQYHLSCIFHTENKSSPFNTAQKWWIKKVFETNEFIASMDSFDAIEIAINATKQNLVKIGSNTTEVFLYYYKHWPETLYERRIEKFTAMQDFDAEKVESEILSNPEGLLSLTDRTLNAFLNKTKFPRLRQYILDNKKTCIRIPFYNLKPILTLPFDVDRPLLAETIKELAAGSRTFLPLLKKETLEDLIEVIKTNPETLPMWLCDEIRIEFDLREGKREICVNEEYRGYDDTDGLNYLKQKYLNGDEKILKYLNKEALIQLAMQPEVNWSQYLPIAEELVSMGEKESADRYFSRIKKELNLENLDLSSIELKTKLASITKTFQEDYKNKLAQKFLGIITGKLQENKDDLWRQSSLFDGCKEKLHEIQSENQKQLENQFELLSKRLINGDLSDDLRAEFKEWHKLVEKAGYFGGKSDKKSSFLGNYLFSFMGRLIGVKDKNSVLFGRDDLEFPDRAFGIDLSENLSSNLEKLHTVFDILGESSQFYEHIELITKKFNTELNFFDKEGIERHLVAYADNELAVYIDGRRENAAYKTHRFYDGQNIKSFKELNSLYLRLDHAEYLQNKLETAYQRLIDTELKYDPEPFQEYLRYKQSSYWTRDSMSTIDPSRPLTKYIEIRKHHSLTHPDMENLAFMHQLQILCEQPKYANLKHKGFFDFDFENNYAVNFRENVKLTFANTTRVSSKKALAENALKMKEHLADFLGHCSNSALYTEFLTDLQNTPILKDYLGLVDLRIENKTTELIANAIVKLIKLPSEDGSSLKLVLGLPVEAANRIPAPQIESNTKHTREPQLVTKFSTQNETKYFHENQGFFNSKADNQQQDQNYPLWLILIFCIPVVGQLGFLLYKFLECCFPLETDQHKFDTKNSH